MRDHQLDQTHQMPMMEAFQSRTMCHLPNILDDSLPHTTFGIMAAAKLEEKDGLSNATLTELQHQRECTK